jgi:hypothetical protein
MRKKDMNGVNPPPPITDPDTSAVCEQCGSDKDVSYRIEPFAEDVHGTIHWMWICGECYYNNCMDI